MRSAVGDDFAANNILLMRSFHFCEQWQVREDASQSSQRMIWPAY